MYDVFERFFCNIADKGNGDEGFLQSLKVLKSLNFDFVFLRP